MKVEIPRGVVRGPMRAAVTMARADGVLVLILVSATVVTALLGLVAVAHGISLLLFVLLATAVHELGHVTAYRMLAPRAPATLECGGLRASLHRDVLPRRADRAVTAAGPLAPLILPIAALPLASGFPAQVVGAGILAVAHLLGLVLPTADRRAWRLAGSQDLAA